MLKRRLLWWLLPAVLAGPSGCASPPAALELIAVAQKGLTQAQDVENQRHQQELDALAGLQKSLDAAFDSDARLAEAGRIHGPGGQPVALSAEWVISARKGYAAARDALADNRTGLEKAHATHLDNLSAARDSLDLAAQLIVLQSDVSQRVKETLLNLQRRFTSP